MAQFVVGQRVQDADGFRATVRYIGPVATSKAKDALWAGVEWDDASRGKHDGAVTTPDGEDVRYFSAPEGSASFVKPTKLKAGISVLEALQQRYVKMDAPLLAPNNVFEGLFANTNREGGQKPIEFVGELNIRARQQLDVIRKCSLRSHGICCLYPGDGRDISDVEEECKNYEELDLQGNLFSSWVEVAALCSPLAKMRHLHLNGNYLGNISQQVHSLIAPRSFAALEILVLNGCGITSWSTVLTLAGEAENLRELYLAENRLADIAECPEAIGMGKVEVLDLSQCHIASWKSVACLARLPSLQVLTLNWNRIDDADPRVLGPSSRGDLSGWSNLVALGLSGTDIASWSCIDRLNLFPALQSLRLQAVPVVKPYGQSEARSLIIARVSALAQLNGSGVSSRERDEAEKGYLRRIYKEGRNEDVSEKHPRYHDLVKKWEDVMAPSAANGTGTTLANELVGITLVPVSASCTSLEPVSKKIPASLSIIRLKQMARRLFGLDVDQMILSFRQDKASICEQLDDDDQSLRYFGVADGVEIFVNETE